MHFCIGLIPLLLEAIENFAQEVESEYGDIEGGINYEGVTLEGLSSNEGVQELYGIQAELLNYDIYTDRISALVEEGVESGEIEEAAAEEIVGNAEEAIADAGTAVEETRLEVIDTASENSGVSRVEAEFEYEEGVRGEFEGRFPDVRFEEISRIDNVQDIKDKIESLRGEISALEESGDGGEQLTAAKQLLEMAESHGVRCLNAEASELGITSLGHENAADNLLNNAERLLEIEVGVDSGSVIFEDNGIIFDGDFVRLPGIEDVKEEVNKENEDAGKFLEGYEELKVKYADIPEKLAVIEEEKARAEKAQELAKKLGEEGKIDEWVEGLRTDGKSEDEIQGELHRKVFDEWNYVYGDEYEPVGLYQTPEEVVSAGEGEQNLEVIGIGRVEVVQEINPETGLYEKKVVGWYDGKPVEEVHEGGGFALGVPYKDPITGVSYSFGANGYSYTTEAGIVHAVDYPENYKPENTYDYGDESFSYRTGSGEEVVYSATGYEVVDTETDTSLVNEPYIAEKTVFADGSFTDLEATGYILNNPKGDARVYAYAPEFGTYQDIASGKVTIPTSAPHLQSTVYDPVTKTYQFNYAGQDWSYSGQGSWTNPAGKPVSMPYVPAPVGREIQGTYLTPSGQTWTYDSSADTWKESSTGARYDVAPNNRYRFNEYTGYMTDPSGKALATVGTSVTGDDGRVYTVTGDKGWIDSEGRAVAPPQVGGVQQPSSMSGYYGGYSGTGGVSGGANSGQGGGGYYGGSGNGYGGKVWGYDSVSKQWVSSETGDKYDSTTGMITRADGSVSSPENRAAGQGSEGVCYGCYYSSGSEQARAYTYNGGSYERTPAGSYAYVGSNGEFQGPSKVTDSSGIVWSRDASGQYNGVKPDGSTITGSEYASQYSTYGGAGGYSSGVSGSGSYGSYGGYGYSGSGGPGTGGYNAEGVYVGGQYGGYTQSGAYVGAGTVVYGSPSGYTGTTSGSSWTQNSDGSWTSSSGETAPSGGTYGTSTGDYSSGGYYSGTSTGSYSGTSSGDSTSGSWSGGSTGSYTSGGTSTSGSTTTSGDGGSTSGSTGGDSGGSTSGSTSGGDGGGSAPSGGVISETAPPRNFIANLLCRFMPSWC